MCLPQTSAEGKARSAFQGGPDHQDPAEQRQLFDLIERILAARTVEKAFGHYAEHLARIGFPHLAYGGNRLIGALDKTLLDDGVVLSTLPPALLTQLADEDMFGHLPMLGWMARNHGCKSWDWLHRRQRDGKLSPNDRRAYEIFQEHELQAGIAISLSDRVPRVRAGILLLGAPGLTQAQVDLLWQTSEQDIWVLSLVLHQRLSNLPYRDPQQLLTQRQREALELTGIGMTTQDIAEQLGVTVGTVEKHLRLARKALAARTTAQAVLLAMSRRQIFVDHGERCSDPKRDEPPTDSAVAPWVYAKFIERAKYAPGMPAP